MSGSRHNSQAITVTKIGALLWITVAMEAPLSRTAMFHITWKKPMLIAPIAANQGRSRRRTSRERGRVIPRPTSKAVKVPKSR